MRRTKILSSLVTRDKNNQKSLSVLIDPDKIKNEESLKNLLKTCEKHCIDFLFVGGSLLVNDSLRETVRLIKENSKIPMILFPGSNLHIDKSADALLFLSLISGRNPDLLIGQHVSAAPVLKNSNIEVLSTGYILVGNDSNTTVAHISQTTPIPTNKNEIAVCTAIAGEMLGMKLIYLDAGSGAKMEVPSEMIMQVKKSIDIPLIVGGGINSSLKIESVFKSGADMVVVGTAIEKNSNFIEKAANIRDQINSVGVIHS